MPLPRRQAIGTAVSEFIYNIAWDTSVRCDASPDPPAVSGHGREAQRSRRRGAGGVPLRRGPRDDGEVRDAVWEIQQGRCFYCRASTAVDRSELDHFIPWARYPDNGLDSLVLVDERCNLDKRAFLATGEHVARWMPRLLSDSSETRQLEDVARTVVGCASVRARSASRARSTSGSLVMRSSGCAVASSWTLTARASPRCSAPPESESPFAVARAKGVASSSGGARRLRSCAAGRLQAAPSDQSALRAPGRHDSGRALQRLRARSRNDGASLGV